MGMWTFNKWKSYIINGVKETTMSNPNVMPRMIHLIGRRGYGRYERTLCCGLDVSQMSPREQLTNEPTLVTCDGGTVVHRPEAGDGTAVQQMTLSGVPCYGFTRCCGMPIRGRTCLTSDEKSITCVGPHSPWRPARDGGYAVPRDIAERLRNGMDLPPHIPFPPDPRVAPVEEATPWAGRPTPQPLIDQLKEAWENIYKTEHRPYPVVAVDRDLHDTMSLTYEVQRLRLEPGDVLVVKSKRRITSEMTQRLKEHLAMIVPNNKVLVLDDDLSVEVLTFEQLEMLKAAAPKKHWADCAMSHDPKAGVCDMGPDCGSKREEPAKPAKPAKPEELPPVDLTAYNLKGKL